MDIHIFRLFEGLCNANSLRKRDVLDKSYFALPGPGPQTLSIKHDQPSPMMEDGLQGEAWLSLYSTWKGSIREMDREVHQQEKGIVSISFLNMGAEGYLECYAISNTRVMTELGHGLLKKDITSVWRWIVEHGKPIRHLWHGNFNQLSVLSLLRKSTLKKMNGYYQSSWGKGFLNLLTNNTDLR